MKSHRLLWPVSLFLLVVLLLAFVVRQAQAAAVGSITIVKDADPADGTDFSFATTPGMAEPTYLLQWGSNGSGNGQFVTPSSVVVDGAGNIYVADADNHRIQKFDSSGAYVTKWGNLGSGNSQFNQPYGLAVDSSGNVYVADTFNHRIQKFTSSGTYVTQWGSNGTGNGQFDRPSGVVVDGLGNVYVADSSPDTFWNCEKVVTQVSSMGQIH